MIDIIIALPVAVGLPVLLLLHRMQQMGLPYDRGKVAALMAIGHGSLALGIAALVLLQILAIAAVVSGIVMYYHWKYRRMYSSDEKIAEVMEGIRELPYTWVTRRLIFNHLLKETIRHITAKARARKKREGII